MTAFLFFLLGITKEKNYFLLIAGAIFSVGLFFSLSLLPLLFIFLVFLLLQKIYFQTKFLHGIAFSIGLFSLPTLLYIIFGYNTIEVSKTLMSGLPEQREYFVWLFYNLYDFFIFSGIPMLLIFILLTGHDSKMC